MRHWYISMLFVLLAVSAFIAQQSGPVADLQPELKQALAHDDACFKPASGAGSDQALAGSVATEPAIPKKIGTEQVVTEQIRVGGREAGIIASPQDGCDCAGGNCSTFVYL